MRTATATVGPLATGAHYLTAAPTCLVDLNDGQHAERVLDAAQVEVGAGATVLALLRSQRTV
jgi:hypothetical protein